MLKKTLPLVTILLSVFAQFAVSDTQCNRDDVVGTWTAYSVDLSVSDHAEYQERITFTYVESEEDVDLFEVTTTGSFSSPVGQWQGQCMGKVYVVSGEISSHGNVHFVQAARNPGAPNTDQCSLERCEATCLGDLAAQCSVSKPIPDKRLSILFLPGHVRQGAESEFRYLASVLDCSGHGCNHPGIEHTHGGSDGGW